MSVIKISPKTKNLFLNYSLMLGAYFLFFFLTGVLNSFLPNLDLSKYQQTELFNLMDESPFTFILMAVVIAPILEESMFRTLIKPSFTEIHIFICAMLAFISLGFIPLQAHVLLKFGVIILSGIIIFLLLQSLKPSTGFRKLRVFLYRNYRIVWWLSAAIFGVVHIWNYVEGWQFDLILFLLIFPRIIAGYFFGKIKVENQSLLWPIAMHAMNNGIVAFFMLPKLFGIY